MAALTHSAFAAASIALCASLAAAQTEPWNRSGLWRLEAPAGFQQTCVAPCTCPPQSADALRGSIQISLITVGNVFDFYEVRSISLSTPQLQWSFSGSGTFAYSPIIPQERMNVTLAQTGNAPRDFNGDAQVPANPDTMDLTLELNEPDCATTAFRIVARRCRADWDRDGAFAPADVAAFINAWLHDLQTNMLVADFDANGAITPADVAAMVNAWFAGLGGGPCT